MTISPIVAGCNFAALIVVAVRARRPTRLQVWLAIALLTSAFEAILSAVSPGRFTTAWYFGKFEALTTAGAVLLMLLCEVATLYRRLFDVASLDPLTGLANRRRLDEDLRSLPARMLAGAGLAMLVVDLDHFKEFNDLHGHLFGDEALRRVASVLRGAACRRFDVVARSGGEEFIVVLPGVSLNDARAVAECVRRSIENASAGRDGDTVLQVTASVGVAFTSDPRTVAAEDLYAAADRALYIAKANGRNRVAFSASDLALSSAK
jgi:diguanylate cyclase (GGDEF)-like protein